MSAFWQSVFRIGVGFFWLFFAYQTWSGNGPSPAAVQAGFVTNPIPGIHEILVLVVLPNWVWFSLLQMAAEVVVGALLVLGLFTRPAAIVGSMLAIDLALTVAFIEPSIVNRWVYYLLVLGNLELAFQASQLTRTGSRPPVRGVGARVAVVLLRDLPEQHLEEGAVALQRHPHRLGVGTVAERAAKLSQVFLTQLRQLLHDLAHQRVGLLRGRVRVVDEGGLNRLPADLEGPGVIR